ncbi:hypothetical protein BP5796_10132 [Coleophoma crateriformis]|uniref:C2H2-type domain-containing protein n=1 Tax=Coleophoma crateriformis TaxID=565419 RepID=A0A3D8QUV1_9HELO|nr:hypothetical protein BP5796_10132 [Coleophoma crateriformis]
MPTPQLPTPSPYLEAQSSSLSNAETSSTARPPSPNVEHHGCNPAWPSFDLGEGDCGSAVVMDEHIRLRNLSLSASMPISHGGLHTPNIASATTQAWESGANTWTQSFQSYGHNPSLPGSNGMVDGWPPHSVDRALHSPSNMLYAIDTNHFQPASNLAAMSGLPMPINMGDYLDYDQVAHSVQSGDNDALLAIGSFLPQQPAPVTLPGNASSRNPQCAICGLVFTRSADLGRHNESVHQKKRHDCHYPGCSNRRGKGWSRADKLRTHQKENHGFF